MTHVVEDFVAPSTPWLGDFVNAVAVDSRRVVCYRRPTSFNADIPVVQGLHLRRRDAGWLLRGVLRRAGAKMSPWNPYRASLRTLRDVQPDIVHAHFGPMGWYCVDSRLRPVVTSFYGFDANDEQVLERFERAYEALWAQGGAFVAEGPHMAARLVALGAPAERTHVVPLVAHDTLRSEPPLPTGSPRVLMAGRFVEKKGFHIGLEAFGRVRAQHPHASLTIMGEGPLEAELRRIAERLGMADTVRWLPFSGRDAYLDAMSGCEVFLQPSLTARSGDSEGGAPTTLFDAQLLSRVIVTTNHADIPFVVARDGAYVARTGDVESLAATLLEAIADASAWQQRGRAGREHVLRQHAPAQVREHALTVYRATLADAH